MSDYDPQRTVLVLIDLQKGIARPGLAPHDADDVVARCRSLAATFRDAGAPVVLVHVGFRNPAELPSLEADKPSLPREGTPPEFYEFVEGVRTDRDLVVLKHHWGAFTGTDLDLQLRRRGITTIVLAGIATNFGVESTARSAWELGYDIVIAEDACTSRSTELHNFAVANIFPQIGRVKPAGEITFVP